MTALVQSTSKEAGTVTSTTLAFGSNVTAGSLKTCLIRTGTGSGVTNSASDNLDGSYTQDIFLAGAPNANLSPSINSKPNATAGATTVTATQSGSSNLRLVIQEVSGIATSSPLDKTASASSAGSTSLASGAVTTTAANEFLCGFLCGNNGTTSAISAGTGWTQDQQILSNADRLLSEYQIVSATGSYNATGSMTASDAWTALIATYKSAAAAVAPFVPVDINASVKASWAGSDFIAPNLLADQILKPPPITQTDLLYKVQWKGVYTDFAPPNLLADQILKPPPIAPIDLSARIQIKAIAPDFIIPNLLTALLPAPPVAPIEATISIRAQGVFTDFSPPNLALSTLAAIAPTHPVEAVLRLEYRWIRGDDIPLNTLVLAQAAVTPLLPQDISGLRLDARGLRSDFIPPNLTLFLPVPPPVPPASGAGRHGTRAQARRRRRLDVLRAKLEAFKEQRIEADRALMAMEDGELRARAKLLKRIRIKPLTKPIEEYAPIKKAIAQRTVVAERHRSILEQILAHQLEAERIQREIEDERDEEAAVQLMHFLMMELPWHE